MIAISNGSLCGIVNVPMAFRFPELGSIDVRGCRAERHVTCTVGAMCICMGHELGLECTQPRRPTGTTVAARRSWDPVGRVQPEASHLLASPPECSRPMPPLKRGRRAPNPEKSRNTLFIFEKRDFNGARASHLTSPLHRQSLPSDECSRPSVLTTFEPMEAPP